MDVEGVYSTNAISGPEWTARDYADNGFEYHGGTNNQGKFGFHRPHDDKL